MNQKTHSAKQLSLVTNDRHGACLMFDRKGLGVSQSFGYQDYALMIKNSLARKMLHNMIMTSRTQIMNMLAAQKQQLLLRYRDTLV